jgi:hypothetical protein
LNRQLIEAENEKTEASAARAEVAAARALAANNRAEQAAIRVQATEARVEESLKSANQAADRSEASRAAAIPIQYNVYNLLTKLGAERSGYGMYTYVLFGRDVGKTALPVHNDISQRYRSLLEAIESASESTSEAGRPSSETNLFCIPALSRKRGLTLANYNSKLSLIYRSRFARVTRGESTRSELLGSSGPLLVSSVHPLAHTQVGSHLLVFDLTSMNAKDMADVVEFYERRIAGEGASDFDFFDHMRLEFYKWKPSSEKIATFIQIVEVVRFFLP